MNESAEWWKNSALLVMLMSVPVVVASCQSGQVTEQPTTPVSSLQSSVPSTRSAHEIAPTDDGMPQLTASDEGGNSPPTLSTTDDDVSYDLVDAKTLDVVSADGNASSAVAIDQPPIEDPSADEADAGGAAEDGAAEDGAAEDGAAESPAAEDPAAQDIEEQEDVSFRDWKFDVEESLRKSVLSDILARVARASEKLDEKIVSIEKMEREIDELRLKIEYLESIKQAYLDEIDP